MCYSAQIENDYSRYVRVVGLGNALNLEDFIKKYWWDQQVPSLKIPKANSPVRNAAANRPAS